MQVAVVTGAAQGLGRRTAEVLAEAGFALALMDLKACTATMAAVQELGVEAIDLTGDLCDEAV